MRKLNDIEYNLVIELINIRLKGLRFIRKFDGMGIDFSDFTDLMGISEIDDLLEEYVGIEGSEESWLTELITHYADDENVDGEYIYHRLLDEYEALLNGGYVISSGGKRKIVK